MSYYIESLIYALLLLLRPGGVIFCILVIFASYFKQKKAEIENAEDEKMRKKQLGSVL